MITYQYECNTCNTQFEVEQSIKDDKLTEYHCDNCGNYQPCTRVIVSANFKLEGSGWGKDGYVKKEDRLGELM